MPRCPRIHGAEVVKAFQRAGFVVDRIKGSHHVMKRDGHPVHLSIPVHPGRDVGVGLLKALIEAAGLSIEEFRELL